MKKTVIGALALLGTTFALAGGNPLHPSYYVNTGVSEAASVSVALPKNPLQPTFYSWNVAQAERANYVETITNPLHPRFARS